MNRSVSQSVRSRRELPFGALLVFLAACNGGSTGSGIPLALDENETVPNDTPAAANALAVGTPMRGDLSVAGDVDCFALPLSAGRTVRLELFATRNDQAGWDGNTNVPRLTLLDTTANLNAKLLEQDLSGNFSDGWSWGFHDLDIPMFQVPATGTYFVAVTQDDQALGGGKYMLRASYVTTPALQQESEASGATGVNDTFATAQAIHSGTIHGFHVSGELDYYSFTVSGPTVVSFELNTYRNGVHDATAFYYDPECTLFGSDGTTVLASNDDTYFYDAAIQYQLETAGTYYFAVDEFSAAAGEYFVSFSTSTGSGAAEVEPNDLSTTANPIAYGGRRQGTITTGETDFYSFSGHSGDMVRLQYFDTGSLQTGTSNVVVSLVGTDGLTALGSGGNQGLKILTTILQETGTFYVQVAGGAGATPYAISLARFATSAPESEPNDTRPTSNSLGERVSGVIGSAGDVDLFRISLRKDQLVRFVCYASSTATDSNGDEDHSGHGSSLAPLIELLDDTGAVVASSTSVPVNGVFTESVTQPLPTAGLVTTAPAGGTYYVRISDANDANGAAYYYVLEYALH